jgi:hypothetical protein
MICLLWIVLRSRSLVVCAFLCARARSRRASRRPALLDAFFLTELTQAGSSTGPWPTIALASARGSLIDPLAVPAPPAAPAPHASRALIAARPRSVALTGGARTLAHLPHVLTSARSSHPSPSPSLGCGRSARAFSSPEPSAPSARHLRATSAPPPRHLSASRRGRLRRRPSRRSPSASCARGGRGPPPLVQEPDGARVRAAAAARSSPH